MYSMGDDSDGESYADHLSPSDGYFASSSSSNAVPRVPNILIPDPTLYTSESGAESKAREADEERLLSPSGTHRKAGEDHHYDNHNNYNYHRHHSNHHNHYRPAGSGYWRDPAQLEQEQAATSTTPRHQQLDSALAHTHSQSSASRTPLWSYLTRGRTPSVYSEAPPVYSPPSPASPFSRIVVNQRVQSRGYSTFTYPMGVANVENERLLGRPGPESIGQPDDEEPSSTPYSRWTRRVRRRLPTWLSWRVLLLGSIILAVSIGFLASSFRIIRVDNDHKKTIVAEPVDQDPPSSSDPEPAPVEGEPAPAAPFQPTYCEDAQYRFEDQILALDFNRGRNVTFIEDQHAHRGLAQVHVAGQVDVRRLDGSSSSSPRLVLEIATNDKGVRLDVFTDEAAQAIKVSVPNKYDSSTPGRSPCVEMRATIWVPEGAELGVLSLGAVHLDVLLLNDLSLRLADYARISSVTGDIRSAAGRPLAYNATGGGHGIAVGATPDYTFVPAPASYIFGPRIIEVSTTSGRIDGNWPLLDMLGLHTTSGGIKVSITPGAALPSDPKPAVLSLSSISGVIHATEPVHEPSRIPPRDYLVDVKSTSGGIHGALAFGAGIEVKSTAGDIVLDLLPAFDGGKLSPAQPAQLETATTSGTTAVRVLEPLWFGAPAGAISNAAAVVARRRSARRALDCLQAVHKSTSGDVGLRYPQAWEGRLQAETTSGQLRVRGREVKIVRSVSGWPGSTLEARKGAGGPGSTIRVHALMGDLDAVIGTE
ncbi:hypothetical protein AAE478_006030 [Parahypoxylon ruwenzoriense]